jgi:proteasome lid subunit RPN8/RPN11
MAFKGKSGMTINDAFESQTLKPVQLMKMGSVLLLAVAASLLLAFRPHNRLLFGLELVFCTIALPAVYVVAKRLKEKVRQQQTEQRLMMHTKAFLNTQEPTSWRAITVVKAPNAETLGERLLAALNTDGSELIRPGFRACYPDAAPAAEAETVVFDALPRRYAIRSLYERRFADLSSSLPKPATMPFSELLPLLDGAGLESWTVGQQNLNIEYSAEVLNEIRMRAAEGYQRIRHGGVEVGGILFGSHLKGMICIQAVRPIACDYSNGPRFVLSKQDEIALADLLLASKTDPAFSEMEPVGWYHSHTRDEICLTPSDVEIFNRFFPASWQVALVVRPANLAPIRAGFFFREASGAIRTESSYREFQLGPATAAAA